MGRFAWILWVAGPLGGTHIRARATGWMCAPGSGSLSVAGSGSGSGSGSSYGFG
ncbi:hypothetical protein CPC08DRAFT_715794 [Agrocybe pediades]|nr:hypothetical protein CPC08DRAFT_715794 [Agrocybe pediades]